MITDYAPAVSAVAAAIAAGMSYMSVREQRDARREAMRPILLAQPIVENERLTFSIHNAGGGIARGVVYAFVEGECYVAGALGTYVKQAVIAPGEEILVDTPLKPVRAKSRGAIACSDANRRSLLFSISHEVLDLREGWRRRPKYASAKEAIEQFYPDTNLDELQEVGVIRERMVRSRT